MFSNHFKIFFVIAVLIGATTASLLIFSMLWMWAMAKPALHTFTT